VRQWLVQFCCAAPEVAGRTVQAALQEQFHLEVSLSQVNRLRAALVGQLPCAMALPPCL
jgi:hypothetical protein